MKKLVFISSLFLLSCNNDKVTISTEEYNKLKGIKVVKPEYPKELKIFDNWNNPTMTIIESDGCEYITYYLGNNAGTITHKGNCRFCQKRLEETIRKIIQEELQKQKLQNEK